MNPSPTASDPILTANAPPARSTLRRDLAWAYVASGARIGSWAFVSAYVYRRGGSAQFAMLALVRGTIGILNYTAVGLAPAMVRVLAESRADGAGIPPIPLPGGGSIERRPVSPPSREQIIYTSGVALAAAAFGVGLLLTAVYSHFFTRWHQVPAALAAQMPRVVLCIGLGTLLRLFSDASGAVVQTRGRIDLDNRRLALTEAAWIGLTCLVPGQSPLAAASLAYAIAGAGLVWMRGRAVAKLNAASARPDLRIARRLLGLGALVLIAQLADYLYAPTDYILINHFLDPGALAAYAPAVQIDAGLTTLVTALSAVVLPRAALAHSAGFGGAVRRYYLRGTLASLAVLFMGAIAMWLIARPLLKVWLGADPGTSAILPMVLIHTVIGGSSAVGRSILLATGRFRAFTASVLAAGALNVAASYCFVKYLNWGVRGIIFGTILAVVARCALWMPWYVMRSLRRDKK